MLADCDENEPRRRERIVWTRNWLRRRQERGVYHQLVRELRSEDEVELTNVALQIGVGHVTHIDLLKIRHLVLQVFEARSKTCNVLQSEILCEKSSSALCYTATIFRATPLREKSVLQVVSCNTTFKMENFISF